MVPLSGSTETRGAGKSDTACPLGVAGVVGNEFLPRVSSGVMVEAGT